MKAKKKKNKTQLELLKGIRKPMPKPGKVMTSKKSEYNRKDTSWRKEHE